MDRDVNVNKKDIVNLSNEQRLVKYKENCVTRYGMSH